MELTKYQRYYKNVLEDFSELQKEYPFSKMTILPTTEPKPVEMIVVAANCNLIEECIASENDFKGDYSRVLKIIVPFDYRENGCEVYGAEWVKLDKIPEKDMHFFGRKESLFQLCIGVPQSFRYLKNVILENVRTAENMLIAYENFIRGNTKNVELIAYSHGKKGRQEYDRNRRKFRTK